MSAELIPNPDQNYFADPALDFAAQQAKLERRRKLAESLVANAMQSNGNSGMAGQVYMVGNQWGNVAQNLGGSVLSALNDRDQADLSAKDSAARQEFLKANGMENLAAADNTSLRGVIEKQVGQQLDYPRQREVEAAKQAIENARIEAQDKRQAALFAQQGELLDRRIAGQKDLKQMPTIHITNSGGNANPFAGAATQAGIDPRDEMPVYRVSKTGELFKYGENGPVAHTGAVAPKPAAAKEPTESERSSAGYLGRMEAAEKNLTDAKPLPYLQQRGLERAPGLTNYSLSQKQQVTRQQQEDWVRAKLRKESGAVIGEEEMAREIRTYFPQAGDGPDVIKQKAQSRAQALEQMRSSAGRAKPTVAPPAGAPAVGAIVKGYRFKGGNPADQNNWEQVK